MSQQPSKANSKEGPGGPTEAKAPTAGSAAPSGSPIEVILRLKPVPAQEESIVLALTSKTVTVPDHSALPAGPAPSSAEFHFDAVLDGSATQEDVFKRSCVSSGLLKQFLDGSQSLLFAYGPSGSGKSHTIFGSEAEPGVIGKVVAQTFAQASHAAEASGGKCYVWISYLELYNEQIYDLFLPSGSSERVALKMAEDAQGQIFVPHLKEVPLHHPSDATEWLAKGVKNRMAAATKLNADSSRSHAIFTLKLAQTPKGFLPSQTNKNDVKFSRFYVVDLAGSERVGKSGVSSREGLREASGINSSLLTLRSCIKALHDNKPHVPYRNSKLTRLVFQNFFEAKASSPAQAKAVMIVNVNPRAGELEETVGALTFASTARRVVLPAPKAPVAPQPVPYTPGQSLPSNAASSALKRAGLSSVKRPGLGAVSVPTLCGGVVPIPFPDLGLHPPTTPGKGGHVMKLAQHFQAQALALGASTPTKGPGPAPHGHPPRPLDFSVPNPRPVSVERSMVPSANEAEALADLRAVEDQIDALRLQLAAALEDTLNVELKLRTELTVQFTAELSALEDFYRSLADRQCQDLERKYKELLGGVSVWGPEDPADVEAGECLGAPPPALPSAWPDLKLDKLAEMQRQIETEGSARSETKLEVRQLRAALSEALADRSPPSPILAPSALQFDSVATTTNTATVVPLGSPKKAHSSPLKGVGKGAKKRKSPAPSDEPLALPIPSPKRQKVANNEEADSATKENAAQSEAALNSKGLDSPQAPRAKASQKAQPKKRLPPRYHKEEVELDQTAMETDESPVVALSAFREPPVTAAPPALLLLGPMPTPVAKRTRTRAARKAKV